jgi:hypothetical protein
LLPSRLKLRDADIVAEGRKLHCFAAQTTLHGWSQTSRQQLVVLILKRKKDFFFLAFTVTTWLNCTCLLGLHAVCTLLLVAEEVIESELRLIALGWMIDGWMDGWMDG